ncbi:phage tail protein [Klebsiella aerogenes]|uniref:phage tail protein n=1 Tax=Klebsiella aerogenes TaxID=548 RepID=UPI002175C56D|nr:phage tail protein [Klebsiella aerogenes]UWC47973.1 phage tail protein [Klebsiella aerogenes]HCJ5308305.1 phage tail protein [Klebsiella aerogenes]
MSEKYYSILTNRGKALEAESAASGKPVILKDFVIGDGNRQAVTPDPVNTTLVHEVYRGAISSLAVSPEQDNQFIAQLVLPADIGGFTVREVGLLTESGELYAVGNCAAIEKPESGVSVQLQFRLAVNETADIELKVATGDGLFLRQDANLSDVADVAQSRKNLELGSAAGHDEGDFLLTSGGAMTGPIGFPVDNDLSSYALNRQAPSSIWDVYKSLTVMNSSWNRIGVIDSKIQFGRAILTIYGSNSHDVGMAVQTGFVMIDIIGTDKKAPGCTLTYYRPDEAKGSSTVSAIVSANPNDGTKYDLWVQTQSAVAGLMMVGQQSYPDFFKPYDPIGHQTTEPTPATPTGVVNLVTANKDGKVNIKGELTVAGKTTFNEEVYLEDKRVMIDEPNPGAVSNGQYVTSEAYCWRLLGRGGTADPAGATAKLFYRELVGTNNEVILHIVGFGNDVSFAFDGGSGDFKAPGSVRAHEVYAGNAYLTGDGNIWGTRWNANGQWLWDAITELNNSTLNYVNSTFVRDVRQGSPGTIVLKRGAWNYVPGGCAFTGWYVEGDAPVDDTIQYKPTQILINGAWRTIAG